MSRYNERLALEWMGAVEDLCPWDVAPDCEGSAIQKVQSAYINTQDSYAEGVVSIVDQPAYLRSMIDDDEALALLPSLPAYD